MVPANFSNFKSTEENHFNLLSILDFIRQLFLKNLLLSNFGSDKHRYDTLLNVDRHANPMALNNVILLYMRAGSFRRYWYRLLIFICVGWQTANAQNHTLQIRVTDSTKQTIENASITINRQQTVLDSGGQKSISLPSIP